MKKLSLILFLFISCRGLAQQAVQTISGTVYASDDKQPLVGATIRAVGKPDGAVTDLKGHYSLNVTHEVKQLQFIFIGYEAQTVKIKNRTQIDVYLKPASRSLNEVVVMGYATQKKMDITGSVASINTGAPGASQVVHIRGTASPVQALQGKVSGIAVTHSNGYLVQPEDESYKYIQDNSFQTAKENPLSTFSVDVDAASYSNVRRFINNGQLPPPDAVRIEEMINYFKYNIPAPTNGEPVAIHTELSTAPWNPAHRLLRIALKARTMDNSKLPPSNLVFLIDVSGSMNMPNKLPLVKTAMRLLVDQLRPQDKVAIVVYAGNAGLVLPSTPGSDKTKINEAIDGMSAGGSTAGGEGIKLAYKIARENFITGGNNRVILSTDGDFNVGASSDEDMEHLIEHERQSNVHLSVLGFGMGNYKDTKMETLADKGNGNYAYIDNLDEAKNKLVKEFGSTMFMVAKDVKLQVEFNPTKVEAYRLLGYEDRLLNKEDFNNDVKDAGDMGAGHTVTAFYEIIPAGAKDPFAPTVDPLKYQLMARIPGNVPSVSNEMLTVKFRYKQPESMVSKLSQKVVYDAPEAFGKTSADFRFAAAVAETGMLLRQSPYKQQATFDQAILIAKDAKDKDEDGYRSEFIRLAESAKLLEKTGLAANK